MSDGTMGVIRWWIEQSDVDDEERVEHLVADAEADVQDAVKGIEDESVVRIKSSVEDDEHVEYAIDLSESLLRKAREELEETDKKPAE